MTSFFTFKTSLISIKPGKMCFEAKCQTIRTMKMESATRHPRQLGLKSYLKFSHFRCKEHSLSMDNLSKSSTSIPYRL